MAGKKKRGGFGSRVVKITAMKAGTRGQSGGRISHADDAKGDHLTSGGGKHIGRTIKEKAHSSHPGMEFVAARGKGAGAKQTSDAKLVPPGHKKKPKSK